ncbi:MAG TPA: DNA polymerase III subunit delta [Candidatus Sulfotelmatobacter sp.]|nr:DNA polymerase III subunit delta [Candidatus Sulfotelmatobacter sp.]
MPRLSAAAFAELLQKGKPVPAVLLLGDEPYLRDECRAQLIDKYVAEAARTWAVSRFSADRGELQTAMDQAETLPMLSPLQLVFLEDAEAIEELGEKAREAAVESLEAYLGNPAPFTILIIEASGLDQRMRLAKLLAEKALVVEVGLGENAEERIRAAVGLAKSLGKECGVEFEKGAAEDLAEFVGGDLMRLKTEVVKLSTYATERKRLRREDITALVVSEKTTTIWELADLLATSRPAKALEFFDRLLREGEEPVMMIGGMAWMYRKLVEASELRGATNGWQAARALGMRPEQAQLALESARKISKERLLDGLRALREADDRLKGGTKDVRAVMEFLVWQLSGARAAAVRFR